MQMPNVSSLHSASQPSQGAARRRNELGSLQKGLLALKALNRQDGMTASQLATQIGVSRTSARRILDTLATAGLVDKLSFDLHYRLAPAAADLSSGLSEEHVLSHVAAPVLEAATQEIGWTLSLVTVGDGNMVLQVTTQNKAAHAITFFRFGDKVPIFASQAGKLAMAYMKDDEREALFDRISQLPGSEIRHVILTPAEAAGLRQKGYYSPNTPASAESHLYVPVFTDRGVPGCLIMRYFVSAVPYIDLEQRYVPLMQKLSATISAQAKTIMRDGMPAWLAQNPASR
jgi:IclR family mhp operon transcriptional activator